MKYADYLDDLLYRFCVVWFFFVSPNSLRTAYKALVTLKAAIGGTFKYY